MTEINELFKKFINSVLNNYYKNVTIEKQLDFEETNIIAKQFIDLINDDAKNYRFFFVSNYKYFNEIIPKILVSDMKENNYFLSYPVLTEDLLLNNSLVNDSYKFEFINKLEDLTIVSINKLSIDYSYIFDSTYNNYEIKCNKSFFYDFSNEKLIHRIINL